MVLLRAQQKYLLAQGFLVLFLAVSQVEARMVHPTGCLGNCETVSRETKETVARQISWDMDLAIEAIPVWEKEPREIFDKLFHAVGKDGEQIAGLTQTEINLNGVRWTAGLDCEIPTSPEAARRCYVTDGTARFEWYHVITGGPEEKVGDANPLSEGITAVTDGYFKGLPVARPRVTVRVQVGWPSIGLQNLPEEWRRPVMESIYLILGHEKLHVDNFIEHLPLVTEAILHPPLTEFEVLPGEDPLEKLNEVARATALEHINQVLYDPKYSNCKRMNCVFDGKGPECENGHLDHLDRTLAASWSAPMEWNPKGWEEQHLKMLIDRGSQFPGQKAPQDFLYPRPFEFRWSKTVD